MEPDTRRFHFSSTTRAGDVNFFLLNRGIQAELVLDALYTTINHLYLTK